MKHRSTPHFVAALTALATMLVAPSQTTPVAAPPHAGEVRCAEGVLAEPIGVGYGDLTRNCAIDDAGDRDRFVFFADAGDSVLVSLSVSRAVSAAATVPLRVEVRDPFGIITGSMTCRSAACEFEFDEALPTIGDYEIAVFALGLGHTAGYRLGLQRARAPEAAR